MGIGDSQRLQTLRSKLLTALKVLDSNLSVARAIQKHYEHLERIGIRRQVAQNLDANAQLEVQVAKMESHKQTAIVLLRQVEGVANLVRLMSKMLDLDNH
jgi:hypothetical protein